jgi:hypothetical protein
VVRVGEVQPDRERGFTSALAASGASLEWRLLGFAVDFVFLLLALGLAAAYALTLVAYRRFVAVAVRRHG